jgi:hypothetical protein
MSQTSSKIARITTCIYAAALVLSASRYAAADDLLGLYVGGSIGQAHVDATGQRFIANGQIYEATGSFDQTHSAFKAMAGIRPIPFLGAEVAYVDLGRPSEGFNSYTASVNMHGESALGVLSVGLTWSF